MIKKLFSLLLILVLLGIMAGCEEGTSETVPKEPQSIDVNDVDSSDDSEISSDIGETDGETDVSLHEYTADEKALLSIDTDKIIFSQLGWTDEGCLDDLSILKGKYPDLNLTDTLYYSSTERWYSEETGLEYSVGHFYYGGEIPSTFMNDMRGQADSLIIGLIAPIETLELMEALGLPESEWAVGEPPDTKKYPDTYAYYEFAYASSDPENSVYIVVPTPGNEKSPTGITITSAMPGFISPTDKLDIRLVVFGN